MEHPKFHRLHSQSTREDVRRYLRELALSDYAYNLNDDVRTVTWSRRHRWSVVVQIEKNAHALWGLHIACRIPWSETLATYAEIIDDET